MAFGRSLSMAALISEGILAPGEKLLTFDYMGTRYEADLLPDGLISWNGSQFSSPYAWASQCKNVVNPDHKSGIGWGHIRYKGIKLSQYKNLYLKKHRQPSSESVTASAAAVRQQPVKPRRRRKKLSSREQAVTSQEETSQEMGLPGNQTAAASFTIKTEPQEQVIVPAAMAQPPTVSANVFHDCTAFEAFGLQQPFTVSISSNVLMLMDFHSHLCTSEVAGYLGGTYDPNTKNLEVMQVFPCRCELNSSEQGAEMEREIQSSMATKGLQLMGWYHSHPASEPKPSQNDVFAQKRYQEAVQLAENREEPCVGLIISPNHGGRLEETKSAFAAFWVLMVQHDGIKASPMQLQYSITWEQYLTQDVVDEMNALATYYKNQPDSTNFRAVWRGDITFMQKLKMSLAAVQPKFPQENSDQTFMSYIEQLVLR